eukprot:2827290-Alexandrium_andersonii.AAC.1
MADLMEAMLFLLVGPPGHLRGPVWARLPSPPGRIKEEPDRESAVSQHLLQHIFRNSLASSVRSA